MQMPSLHLNLGRRSATDLVGLDIQPRFVAADGTPLWSYATGGTVSSSAAIGADGTVYTGSFDRKLYAFSP